MEVSTSTSSELIDYTQRPFDTSVLAKERGEAVPADISRVGSSGYSIASMERFLWRAGMPLIRGIIYAEFLWKASDLLNHTISMTSIERDTSIKSSRIYEAKSDFLKAGLITQTTNGKGSPNMFGFCRIDEAVARIKAYWPQRPGVARLANLAKGPGSPLGSILSLPEPVLVPQVGLTVETAVIEKE